MNKGYRIQQALGAAGKTEINLVTKDNVDRIAQRSEISSADIIPAPGADETHPCVAGQESHT
jgi:hypothetical protein